MQDDQTPIVCEILQKYVFQISRFKATSQSRISHDKISYWEIFGAIVLCANVGAISYTLMHIAYTTF